MAIINQITDVAGGTSILVYTCPAGISHAVVHVYATNFSNANMFVSLNTVSTVNNTQIFMRVPAPPSTDVTSSGPVSMFLKPGDFIRAYAGAGGNATVLLTGYTVA